MEFLTIRPFLTLSRSAVFFFKLTADQGLVVDWIAGSSQVRHSHTPDRGLIFALFLWLDAATQPRYVSKALDSRCFSCSGTVGYGLENIFFWHFSLVSVQV